MLQPTKSRTPLLDALLPLLAAARPLCRQERTFVRLAVLTLGLLVALGRRTVSQVLVGLGAGEQPWAAWYRLFSADRIDHAAAERQVLAAVLREVPAGEPLAVVLDATHLPRTGRRMPGVGWARAPRTPVFKLGIQRAQRWVGLTLLLPRTPDGMSRALPVRWLPAPTPRATPLPGHPPLREWQAGLALLDWLRTELDAAGRAGQRVLALADGAYAPAQLWAALPPRTVLLARCARNRALWALPMRRPPDQPVRGRRRVYGERGPTPADQLHGRGGWTQVGFMVRGRPVTPRVRVTGPWLVRGAPAVPLFLLVVAGVARGRGVTRRQRQPTFLLVNAVPADQGGWALPLPVADLLAWAWQRWEVEVMHRELKSTFGLGQAQAWSPGGTVGTTQWLVWAYALLLLAGYRCWGLGPGPGRPPGAWQRPRRWSLGTLWAAYRAELWQLGEFQPVWTRSPDTWAEMERWLATQTNALRGLRHL